MRRTFTTSVGIKAIAVLMVAAVVPLAVAGLYSATVTDRALTRQSLDGIEFRARQHADRIEGFLQRIHADVRFLSQVPPIQGIIRARDGGGYDQQGQSAYADWVDRLQTIFSIFGENHPFVVQLRYLDEQGFELVRINTVEGKPQVVSGEALQNKAATTYFRETMEMASDRVYVSPLELNVEHGVIELPPRSVIRFGLPVEDGNGQRRGMVVLNLSGRHLVEIVPGNTEIHDHEHLIVDRDGYFLEHPDATRNWGGQLSHGFTAERAFGSQAAALTAVAAGSIADLQGNIAAHVPIHYDPSDQKRYWKLIARVPRSTALASVERSRLLMVTLVLISPLLALGIGYWLSRRWFVAPLVRLEKIIQAFGTGQREARAAAGSRDEIGRLGGAFNTMADKLDQARRELEQRVEERTAELAASEIHMRTVVDTAMDAIVSANDDGIIIDFNPAAENMFGISREKAVGQGIELLHPWHIEAGGNRQQKLAARGWPQTMIGRISEQVRRRENGEEFPVEIAVAQADLAGRRITVGNLREITARKRIEREMKEARHRAEQANRAKSQFLANMSHDLRTPLNAIIGFSEMISREMLGPIGSLKYKSYVEAIADSGNHLMGLINDVLDLSKAEAGRIELDERRVDIPETAESCLAMLRQRAEDSKITLDTDIADDLPRLWADQRRLAQILINLLTNAVKFTPPGGRVTLAAEKIHDGGLCLSVNDTGIGIEADQLDYVMQPFAQAEDVLESNQEGTGLGLALVTTLVELHEGHFELTSQPGQGTTACIEFPPHRVVGKGAVEG